VNVTDQSFQKPDPLVQLPAIEKLEEEIKSEFYELRQGKIWFSEEMKREHRRLKTSLLRYVVQSRIMAILTAPFIYAVIIPFVLLDLFVSVYQAVCFPVYGVPKARRRDYIALEGFNCLYCSYGNGVLAYAVEVAGRTEQHWCPIRHARRVKNVHDRYEYFLPYGDAKAYRQELEKVRCDFKDLNRKK
jgi:hypothetical protein